MEINLGPFLLGLVMLMISTILKDLVKLLRSNPHRLEPKYMNEENTVKGTRLEIDKNGYVIVIATKRLSLNWYM